jgi:general secretion pathway protein F
VPVYTWKGLNATGKAVAGTKDADSPKGLRLVLRREGVFVTEHKEMLAAGAKPGAPKAAGAVTASGEKVPFWKREIDFGGLLVRVRPQEVAVFTRQLATLLHAGITLAEALSALSDQSDNKAFGVVLTDVKQRVNEGGSLAESMGQHPKVFPELYTNMVRSGEAAGNLDDVLARLADFMDAQNALRSKVSSAMTYPIIMMVLGSGIMTLLMIVVVPKITSIFEDQAKTLPWNTSLLIFISDTLGSFWWLLAILGGLTYWGYKRWTSKPAGRRKVDTFKLNLPLLGPLTRYVAVARFARTLATMLAAGVPVLNALDIVKRVLNNVVLEKVVEEGRDAIREGESIAATLKKSGQFPSMMVHMVNVGERSGQLETMLENVAIAYEREVDGKVARLTTVLSPALIVGMAVAVAFIVFSVLQPILEMQDMVT